MAIVRTWRHLQLLGHTLEAASIGGLFISEKFASAMSPSGRILLKKVEDNLKSTELGALRARSIAGAVLLLCWLEVWHRYQLRHFAEVLGGSRSRRDMRQCIRRGFSGALMSSTIIQLVSATFSK